MFYPRLLKTVGMILGACVLGACGEVSQADREMQAAPLLTTAELQSKLSEIHTARPEVPGFAISVVLPDQTIISASSGVAAPDETPMTPRTPVRLASTSKTFVAAAILRLAEQDQLNIDASIENYVSDNVLELLRQDGYVTASITLRHLLLHAGGLHDHFQSPDYQLMALSNPDRVWTAYDQLTMFVETTDKLSEPGEAYFYSDPGFILLGLTLEHVTQQSMGQAVRDLLKLDDLGLAGSWWEGEQSPPDSSARAHQWLGDYDAYYVHGSVDAFGGGGLIASMEGTAQFFHALFSGRVFADEQTLAAMVEGQGHPEDSPYRFGLFVNEHAGYQIYGHSGFWGTDAIAVPELSIAIASVALDQDGLDAMLELEGELIELIGQRIKLD